jgi:hypothetical protein
MLQHGEEYEEGQLSPHMKNKIDPKQYKSVKTGNTKQIGSYTSEE